MRIESSTQRLTHTYKAWWAVNGSLAFDNTRTRTVESRYFQRPDITVNPRNEYGFRAPSKYDGYLRNYRSPSVVSQFVLDGQLRFELSEVDLPFASIFGTVNGTAANWENSLKQQALRSIKDQKVNLSMTLAFLPQTLKMIRGNFSTIGSVLLAAQKADWRSVARYLKVNPKSTSSFYLEVLFGWLQLIRDTQGIVEELHRKCNKPQHTFVYGRATRAQDINPIVLVRRPYTVGEPPGEYTFQGDRKIDHRLVLVYRGETALLSRLSQLGLLNPAELMWDLVPWSWVVNMGTSIGDFVSTLDATVGLTYLGGTYTRYARTAGPVTVSKYTSNRQNWILNTTPGFYEEMRFSRKVIDDKIDPFVLKNPFSAPIALTAAVIAAVVQRGGKATPQPPRGSTRKVLRY